MLFDVRYFKSPLLEVNSRGMGASTKRALLHVPIILCASVSRKQRKRERSSSPDLKELRDSAHGLLYRGSSSMYFFPSVNGLLDFYGQDLVVLDQHIRRSCQLLTLSCLPKHNQRKWGEHYDYASQDGLLSLLPFFKRESYTELFFIEVSFL